MTYAPAFPKTVNGYTRAEARQARVTAEDRQRREVYRQVDVRDQGHCRICGRRVAAGAISAADRAEHHHIVKRSQGGPDTTANVLLVCVARCHDDIHVRGVLKLSGDADLRNERGQLAGVKVETLREHGWEVTAWR